MDLTEAQDIMKRWQNYTEELHTHTHTHTQNLHDPDNHGGVSTHLEPDILESKVKWVLGSIPMNKASGGDGIPDRKSTRLNSSHLLLSRMPSSA